MNLTNLYCYLLTAARGRGRGGPPGVQGRGRAPWQTGNNAGQAGRGRGQ